MRSKKELIISAFENLDANLLDVLLADGQQYSNVSKSLFIEVYRRFVCLVKKYPEFDTFYKAYSATTFIEDEIVTGFIFVNKHGICCLKLAFEVFDNEVIDIRQCKELSTDEVVIERTMVGISFYQDEEIGFIPDDNYGMICQKCIAEVKKLQKMRNEEGALSRDSITKWFIANEDFFVEYVLPYGYYYSKCAEFINYYNLFRRYKTSNEVEKLCKDFCQEFYRFPIVDKNSISNWLSRVNEKVSNAKAGFWCKSDFKRGYFRESHVKMFLPDFYFTQNLGEIMYQYKEWIPNACEKS